MEHRRMSKKKMMQSERDLNHFNQTFFIKKFKHCLSSNQGCLNGYYTEEAYATPVFWVCLAGKKTL